LQGFQPFLLLHRIALGPGRILCSLVHAAFRVSFGFLRIDL
jgi:hypothetical protein